MAPHKKCPQPLGGFLFYEVWRSEKDEPEVPKTRVITGDGDDDDDDNDDDDDEDQEDDDDDVNGEREKGHNRGTDD